MARSATFWGLLRSKPKEGQQVFADGFMDPPVGKWDLNSSPVPFLRSLPMKVRAEGEGVEKTHLGKILNGVRLGEIDFKEDIWIALRPTQTLSTSHIVRV